MIAKAGRISEVSAYRPHHRRRTRFATFAPCFPSAVRVFLDKCEMVFFLFAAAAAFLMFLRAAARCFVLAMMSLL